MLRSSKPVAKAEKKEKMETEPVPKLVQKKDVKGKEEEWETDSEDEDQPIAKRNLYERKSTGFNRNQPHLVDDEDEDEDE